MSLHGGEGNPREEEKLSLAKKEEKAVWMFRLLTMLVLVSVTVAVCVGVYLQSRNAEKEDFENTFLELGEKLVSSFETDVKQRVAAMESLAVSLAAGVAGSNETWPFTTPPEFHARAEYTKFLSRSSGIYLLPRVNPGQKQEWEAYARKNQGWIAQGLAQQLGVDPESLTVNKIAPVILTNKIEGKPQPDTSEGPWFPFWCANPVGNRTFTNINPRSNPRKGYQAIKRVLDKRTPTFAASTHFWNVSDRDRATHNTFRTIKASRPHYEGEPYFLSYYPGK